MDKSRYDCDKCGARLEYRFMLPRCEANDYDDDPPSVYQCPECKSVELL